MPDQDSEGHRVEQSTRRAYSRAPAVDQALRDLKREGAPRRRGEASKTIEVALKTVTPILGGSPILRTVDAIDVIRAPTLRGHLRFWWRALNAHRFESAKQLFEAESKIWGAASGAGERSRVDVVVTLISTPEQIKRLKRDDHSMEPGAYVLWPARGQGTGIPPTERYTEGIIFRVALRAPEPCSKEVEHALKAWILFGGYGSRTRRGLGSVAPIDREDWLPEYATRQSIREIFDGVDVFAAHESGEDALDTPVLSHASLLIHDEENTNSVEVWGSAIGWLRDFRQGAGSGARNPDPTRSRNSNDKNEGRPSISNWPEADMIRKVCWHGKRGDEGWWPHKSRPWVHRGWPRAGFGLPIQFRFQQEDRSKNKKAYKEPHAQMLVWSRNRRMYSRLASPLILKTLPLRSGKFVPCALWLNRAYPEGGRVQLQSFDASLSGATFDASFSADGIPRIPDFVKRAGKDGLRVAFCEWLESKKNASRLTRA